MSELQGLIAKTSIRQIKKNQSQILEQDFALFIPQSIDFSNLGMTKTEDRIFSQNKARIA